MQGSGRFYKLRKRRNRPRPHGAREITEAESCTGMVKFNDPATAHKAAQRRVGRSAYRCRFCGSWHVGTNRK